MAGRSRTPHVRVRSRRGIALFIVMIFIVAIAALAITAIVTTGNAALIAKSYARENDLKYSAEAALAIGKSRINYDASALPDTGYRVLMSDAVLSSADGQTIPGVTVTVYVGPTGSTSGQFGRFASIVAEARDNQGNGFIRRLEVTQESFAKYAYWSDQESNGSGTIYFGSGDQLWGPVWSNDVIHIDNSGATFNDDVATAKTISGISYGTFRKGYKQNQTAIQLPSTSSLAARLSGFATASGWNFSAPNDDDAEDVRLRIEFVAVDMNSDGDSLDTGEGFFRVYQANSGNAEWLRADWPGSSPDPEDLTTCGDWHTVSGASDEKFFPASVHATQWFRKMMQAAGMSSSAAKAESAATVTTIMNKAGSRCFLGGDPHLAAVARRGVTGYDSTAWQKGGDDTTFTPTGNFGAWIRDTAPVLTEVSAKRPWDAAYLFPIHRSMNASAKGVIYSNGTVGVSGTLRGAVTVYGGGTVVVLDDLRYANDPGKETPTGQAPCEDMLGLVAADNIVVADNALLTPQKVKSSFFGSTYRSLDDTKDLYLHGVVMALNTSFTVEDYDSGPSNVNDCEGDDNGRGCLYLAGGLIQKNRGPVGLLSGQGFTKRYSYDRCAIVNPPPYFPTTGRFTDNRYYELNPVGFDPAALYHSLTPEP